VQPRAENGSPGFTMQGPRESGARHDCQAQARKHVGAIGERLGSPRHRRGWVLVAVLCVFLHVLGACAFGDAKELDPGGVRCPRC
jgi:hypothetical protein